MILQEDLERFKSAEKARWDDTIKAIKDEITNLCSSLYFSSSSYGALNMKFQDTKWEERAQAVVEEVQNRLNSEFMLIEHKEYEHLKVGITNSFDISLRKLT